MLIHRGFESFFVHIKPLFARDIARDLEGQSVCCVKVKGTMTVKEGSLHTIESKCFGVTQPVE